MSGLITVKERGLMLDCARKYFSPSFIKKTLDLMHDIGMNTFQIHFSQNEGFRIECETFPEIVSDEHLTKVEVHDIIEYANERGIQVIPELDSPGHLRQFLDYNPQWRLPYEGEDPNSPIQNNALDITNKEAVEAIKRLYSEYFELFKDSKYFHIGGDEFINFNQVEDFPKLKEASIAKYGEGADGTEVYIDYINDMCEFVSEAGFIPRVWNDGFYRANQSGLTELSKLPEVSYWTRWDKNMASLETWEEKGYTLLNCNDNYFYLVLGENAGYKYPIAQKILDEWEPNIYSGGQVQKSNEVAAVYFLIWSDIPDALTEDEVFDKLVEPMTAMMEKVKLAEARGE